MNRKTFGIFIGGIASWARDEKTVRNGFHEHIQREPVDHELIDRIFLSWDLSKVGALSFQVSPSSLLSYSSASRIQMRHFLGRCFWIRFCSLQRFNVESRLVIYYSRQRSRWILN